MRRWSPLALFLLLSVVCLYLVATPAVAEEDVEEDDVDLVDSVTDDLVSGGHPLDDTATSTVSIPSDEAEDDAAETATSTPIPKVPYTPLSSAVTKDLDFLDSFDGAVFSRWVKSSNPKFSGGWKQSAREIEAIEGDLGLKVMDEARHHGISTTLGGKTFPVDGKPLTVSYEAKFEEGLMCGGAYLKLFDTAQTSDKSLSTFDNETPYVVMFGPDVCGATNKVHLIIKDKNPISGAWTEHHLTEPPRVPYGKLTHQYAFTINPDDSFNLYVDGKVQRSGSLHKDFEPPFTPPKEIDDPEDHKPEDWVDVEEIPDPEAKKPEDWDEAAPRMIEDSSATMPEGWLLDEPARVPDEKATEPEDWNAAEKGPWRAPLIANPKCESAPGCGPWSPPLISNPNYKGLWTAPMIPNPAYKGPWTVRRIANPEYFLNEHPHKLSSFNAVGFELWTMQKGLLFDNLVVTASTANLTPFLQATFDVRHKIEDSIASAGPIGSKGDKASMGGDVGFFQRLAVGATYFSLDHPTVTIVSGAGILIVTVLLMVRTLRRQRQPTSVPPTTAAPKDPAAETPTTTPTANATAGATDTTAGGGEQPAASPPAEGEAEDEAEAEEETDEATTTGKTEEQQKARQRKPRKEKRQED